MHCFSKSKRRARYERVCAAGKLSVMGVLRVLIRKQHSHTWCSSGTVILLCREEKERKRVGERESEREYKFYMGSCACVWVCECVVVQRSMDDDARINRLKLCVCVFVYTRERMANQRTFSAIWWLLFLEIFTHRRRLGVGDAHSYLLSCIRMWVVAFPYTYIHPLTSVHMVVCVYIFNNVYLGKLSNVFY